MLVLEFKAKGKTTQYAAIDEAIKTAQFVRNKSVRFWIDNRGIGVGSMNEESPLLKERRVSTQIGSENKLLQRELTLLSKNV